MLLHHQSLLTANKCIIANELKGRMNIRRQEGMPVRKMTIIVSPVYDTELTSKHARVTSLPVREQWFADL